MLHPMTKTKDMKDLKLMNHQTLKVDENVTCCRLVKQRHSPAISQKNHVTI